MRLSKDPLLSAEMIRARIAEMGRQITESYGELPLVLVCVLKGGAIFAADLARNIDLPLEMEFARARSYAGQESAGNVELALLPDIPLAGRHVLVVEDILDTGRTSRAILAALGGQHPASLKICALLDKPSRRAVPVEGDWIGFTIEDHFVVGFGLDFNERYRGLPAVHILEADG